MALIDLTARTIHGKIVYYGPAFSGKTTSLAYLHGVVPARARGELHSIASPDERTLFFDYLPLALGAGGFAIRYQLYTVPGQPRYEATRQAVLSGADGIVFVADAQAARLPDNRASLAELGRNLAARGTPLATMPVVFQYNKADMPDALSATELDAALNPDRAPAIATVASTGEGVLDVLRLICQRVTRSL